MFGIYGSMLTPKMIFVLGLTNTLLDAVVKTTLLLVLAALIAACARRASAGFRHLIWTLSLGCALCLPLLSAHLPHWRMPVTTPPTHLQPTAPEVPSPIIDTSPAMPKTTVMPNTQPQTSIASDHATEAIVHAAPSTPKTITPAPIKANSTLAPAPATPAPEIVWRAWLLLIWAGGSIFVLTRLVQSLAGVRRIARTSIAIGDGPMADVMESAAKTMGIRRSVALRQASSAGQAIVPFTYGTFRPVIVLPTNVQEWPEERLQAVLLHELAHVKRHDWMLQIIAYCACALYWFHPFVWMAARRMRTESESASDDLVLSVGLPAKDYARHLLDVALCARQSRSISHAMIAMAQTSKVEVRLRAILAHGLSRRPVTAMSVTGFTTLALLIVLPLASVRLSAQKEAISKVGTSDAATAPPMTAAVVLPNGVTVHLAGVADTQASGPTQWWAQDGSPVIQAIPKSTLHIPIFAKHPGRTFAVMMAYNLASQPEFIWATLPRFASKYARSSKDSDVYHVKPSFTWEYEPYAHFHPLDSDLEPETMRGLDRVQTTFDVRYFRPSQKSVTLKYGVAAGPWTKSVICKKTPGKVTIKTASGDVIFTLFPNPHHLSAAQSASGIARFSVSDHFRTPSPLKSATPFQTSLYAGENYDRDVFAMDSAGHVVMDLHGIISTHSDDVRGKGRSIKTVQYTAISNVLLRDIVSFRLVARPFHWVEFHNVPLEPSVVALKQNISSMISNLTPDATAAIGHVTLGRKAQQRGQPRDGIPEFRRAVALNPDNTDAQFLLAQALYQINDKRVGTTTYAHPAPPAVLDEAIQHMKKDVDLLPFNPVSQSILGTYLANRGRYVEAIFYYRQALHLLVPPSPKAGFSPTHAQTESVQQIFDNQWLLGDALVRTNQYSKAIVQYQAALRFNPKSDWVLLGYGDALNGVGRHAEAHAAWKNIITLSGLDSAYGRLAQTRLAKS